MSADRRSTSLALLLAVILLPAALSRCAHEPRTKPEPLPPPGDTLLAAERSAMKAQVIDRLLARELNLVEAAAAFRELNAHPADCPALGWRLLPGLSDGEKMCRQVIS